MPQNNNEVIGQLGRILSSSLFSSSSRSSEFLRYCIEQMLQGNETEIKESTLGVAVFGRPPDYDPKADAIVRVHARRIREKLDAYYKTAGIHDDLIISIPKGGYVPLIGRRATLAAHEEAESQPAPSIATPRRRGSPTRGWIVSAALLCLLAAGYFLWLRLHHAADTPMRATADPHLFTWFPGLEEEPAWSPDNQTIAYSWDEGHPGFPHIFLQKLDQAEPRRLTKETMPEERPVWSRDGHEIAFLRSASSSRFDVMRLNLVTGAETQVGSFSYSWAIISDPPSLDWSADGRQFLVSEQPAPGLPVRLALMDSVTGKLSPLTQPSYGTSGDFDGRFSPDGTSIAFRRGGLGDLCSASLRDGEKDVHRLTTSGMGVRGIAWSTDNHFIFFGNHRDSGGYSIWRKSTASGETQALTAFGFDATEPALSPDAKYLAFVHHERVVNLVEESLAGGAERVLSPSDRLDSSPVFSDDGRYLAFISIRSGSEELWMQSADGAGLTQLTFLHGAGRPLNASWAPDGKSIVVAIRQEDSTNLFLCALQARRLQQLTFVKDRLVSPLFSRDGRFIYFSSNAEGENRIWRMSTAGNGKPEQMFGDTTSFFQQSEDGRYLYFLGSGQTLNVLRRDLVTGELRSVFKSDQHVFPFPAFVIAGPILYIALPEAPTRSGASILALNLSRNTATSVLHVKRFIAGIPPGLAYSPTRKSLVIPEIQRDNADIYTLPLAP